MICEFLVFRPRMYGHCYMSLEKYGNIVINGNIL